MEGESFCIDTAIDMERESDSIDSEKMELIKSSSDHSGKENEKAINDEKMKLMENS
ncbi:hypothetical protein HAX54_003182, partial [Datura stramonium]|nr:hypothetical protein [Datura stramonium]